MKFQLCTFSVIAQNWVSTLRFIDENKKKTKLLSKKISRGKKESQVLKKIQIDYDGEIREREREKTKKV